jgi:hypothetical protein
MPAPSFLGNSTQVTTLGTSSINITKAGVSGSGSIMLVIFVFATTAKSYNVPAGFARLPSPFVVSTLADAFYRIIDGSEGSTFNVSVTSGTANLRGWSVSYQDVDPLNPFATISIMSQPSAGTSHALPSLTIPADVTYMSCIVMRNGSTATLTKPASMTQNVQTNTNIAAAVASETVTAGATGTRTWTWSGTSIVPGVIFALNTYNPYTPKMKSPIVAGVKKTVTSDSVIIGGVKKPIASVSIIIGGVKKAVP